MIALKATVEGLESLNVYKPEDNAIGDREKEAYDLEAKGDVLFWEGVRAERSNRTDRLFYCPLFDAAPELDYVSKSRYKEALRHFVSESPFPSSTSVNACGRTDRLFYFSLFEPFQSWTLCQSVGTRRA